VNCRNYILHTVHIKLNVCFQSKATAPAGNDVSGRVFNARLMAISQFVSGKSCCRPVWKRISLVFFGPRADAEYVHSCAGHNVFRMQTSQCSRHVDSVLPTLTSKSRSNAVQVLFKCPLTFRTESISFLTFEWFALSPIYLYHKDELTLAANL
jgi:hypothetical protein